MAEAEDSVPSAIALPIRQKQQKQQLTKGMEHMRSYVTISDQTAVPLRANGDLGKDAYGVPASYEPIRQQHDENNNANEQKRSDPFQFGTRYLAEGDDIFAFNAWDHVDVDPQYSEFITQQTEFQRENQVSDFDKNRFNSQPEKWWDKFYSNNATNFFKDRKWLVQEFPVLGEITKEDYGPVTVLEVGAGAGNTAFPLLAMNQNTSLRLHACDYSKKAIGLIRSQEAYTSQLQPATLHASVWDAASTSLPDGLTPGSLDLVLLIFIFSALSPSQWNQAVKNVWDLLKPGGEVLFRDYGRGDLAQVRFKKGRYLDENFYVRGDGTRVYFFEQDELRQIWTGSSRAVTPPNEIGHTLIDYRNGNDANVTGHHERTESKANQDVTNEHDQMSFEVLALATDRRMLVNRQRKIKMYRCWLQGRFRKPTNMVTVASQQMQSALSDG